MLDPHSLIASGGLLLIAAIIFAESGMMVGFFFPGDTLLISAGVFAASGKLPLAAVIVVASLAAIAGDNTGYHLGRLLGPKLFRRPDGLVFRQEYVQQAEEFFERFGAKAMLLAHFVPVVRTFLPIVAGVGRMHRGKFVLFDAVGDIAWAVLITLLGYYVGSKIPGLDHYILILVALAVIFTFAPVAWRLATHKELRQHVLNRLSSRSKKD